MHPEDPAGVLAGRARFAAEAGGEAGVAQRQPVSVEDLIAVKRRQGDLGGADQVEVVLGQVVDLLLGVGQIAGADQRALAHEHGRDHRLEALPDELVHRVAHECQFDQHEVAAQNCEARAGQRRAMLHVDHRPRQCEVVKPLTPGDADLAQDRVGGRRVLCRDVRQTQQQLVEVATNRRLQVGQLAPTGRQCRHLLALIGRRRATPALAEAVLLGAQSLELGRQPAPALVELEHTVDRVVTDVASPRERRADGVRFASDQPDVEHAFSRTLVNRPFRL